MWFWVLVTYLLLILIVFNARFLSPIINFKRRYDFAKTIPGPKWMELIKNSKEDRILKWLISLREKYGTIFRIWMGKDLFVFFTDPDDIKLILSDNKLLHKSNNYEMLETWLGKGLVTNNGDDWFKKRRLLTPAFHFKILSAFKSPMEERCDVLISKLKAHTNGEPFDIYPYITLYTLDVICETAMGFKKNALEESESKYVKAVKTMCKIQHKRSFSLLHRFTIVFNLSLLGRESRQAINILHNETDRVIKLRREFLDQNNINSIEDADLRDDIPGKKRLAFLDMLLITQKSGAKLSDQNIREEVDTFMFAGHDTTSSAIGFAIYLLSKHSDVQEKAYQEAKTYLDGNLEEMTYLQAIIKETLRIFPTVPFFSRLLTEDWEIKNMTIPKGTAVSILAYAIHHDSNIFPDADKFIPERHLDNSKQHPFSYIPFSAGARNCIGQKFALLELKCSLAKILRNFQILPVEGFEVELLPEVVLKTRNGIQVRLKSRTN